MFEKRVQLKESLPNQARGNPRLSPPGPGIVGASSENPPPPRTSLKAPTFMPPNPVREHIPHHGPGWVGSPSEPVTPATNSRSPRQRLGAPAADG